MTTIELVPLRNWPTEAGYYWLQWTARRAPQRIWVLNGGESWGWFSGDSPWTFEMSLNDEGTTKSAVRWFQEVWREQN